MSKLDEHAKRLTELAQHILINASTTARRPDESQSTARPFTRAMLETPLGDLIRDMDPSEIGLFTLVQPTQAASSHAPEEAPVPTTSEIARIDVPTATPLRRPPVRHARDESSRPREHEPEVYAQAALKYLDRYSSIRPMPRASEQAERIIEQLVAVRQNIYELSETLNQTTIAESSSPPSSPTSAIKAEERRIQEIRAEMAALKQKKEALLKKKTGVRAAPKLAHPKPKPKPPPTPKSPDAQEESFWSTPAANARTLHFNEDLLTDETMDLANSSAYASPIPESKSHVPPTLGGVSRPSSRGRHMSFSEPHRRDVSGDTPENNPPLDDLAVDNTPLMQRLEAARDVSPEPSTSLADDGDMTVRLAPASAPSEELEAASSISSIPKKTRVKVTTELESIVTKIWSTIGDIIWPGNPFDVNGLNGSKPPHAKATIAHLQSLTTQTPIPGSPTASLSSLATTPPATGQVTIYQILVAHVLLALLNSPPHYTMPLNQVKTVIAESGHGKGLIGAALTRPIYNLVAKRCLKIDRTGREQIVKFTV